MNLFDQIFLENNGLFEGIRIGDYENNRAIANNIPDIKGVYVVISTTLPEEDYLKVGSGGFFKGKNPNVSEEYMQRNWVNSTRILYVGKAGGKNANGNTSNSTLRERITAYSKFGQGDNIGHWGGRLIWQLPYSRDLFIYWRACTDEENPVELEKRMICEFEENYGKIPFANLRH